MNAALDTRDNDTRADRNRINALHSTGPRTEAGKSISKLNAVKTALTGRTVLLPGDDAARYEAHIAAWTADLKPEGARESALVQSIADAHWRTDRIVNLEFSLYAQGRILLEPQVSEQFPNADAALFAQLLEAHIHTTYEKQLRNLSIQEGRIRRQRDKDMKELQTLQAERRETAESAQAAEGKNAARAAGTLGSGFDFSAAVSQALGRFPTSHQLASGATDTASNLPTGGQQL